jgi:hypothetical protein
MNSVAKHFALQAGGSHYPDVGGATLDAFYRMVVKDIMQFTDDLIEDEYFDISTAIKERYLDAS